MCNAGFPSVHSLTVHFRTDADHVLAMSAATHSFTCKQFLGIHECLRSYDSINSYCRHLRTAHQNEGQLPHPQAQDVDANNEQDEEMVDEGLNVHVQEDENEHLAFNIADIRPADFIRSFSNAALGFVTKLYSLPHVNRELVQTIIANTSEFLLSGYMDMLRAKVERFAQFVENHEEEKQEIDELFAVLRDPFYMLKTEHERFDVLSETSLFLKPSRFVMGERVENVRRNNQVIPEMVTVYGQEVKLRFILKNFLQLPNTLNSILENMNFLNQEQHVVSNVIQGSVWRECSEQFPEGRLVLPLTIYYDDFVPDHVLLSHTTDHELGGLYCDIPVIPQEHLGKLENIFVTSIILTKDRKQFGNEMSFNSVIREFQFLYNEGIEVETENGVFQVYFCLCCMLGDNKGLNEICGFAGGFGANFYCRLCKGHRDELKYLSNIDHIPLRTPENYVIDLEANNFQETGIHELCTWNAVPKFHCCINVVCDLLHDWNEGDFWFCMSRILWCLIYEQEYFTLETLIARAEGFDYGPLENGNKPPVFKLTTEKLQADKCPFSGSEMLCFMRYFGEMVGDLVPEGDVYWDFYISHKIIIDILFAPSFERGAENYVKVLLEEHNETYLQLFNEPLKPKQHLLLHYFLIMIRFGPLLHLWTMRKEGKNKELKGFANDTNSRIDLSLTVFTKIMLKFCQRLVSKRGLLNDIISGPSKISHLQDVPHFYEFQGDILNGNQLCALVPWVEVRQTKYNIGLCVCIRIVENNPTFGKIHYIVTSEPRNVSFTVNVLNTVAFHPHFHAYVVNETERWELIPVDQLAHHEPAHSRIIGNGLCVISLRHH